VSEREEAWDRWLDTLPGGTIAVVQERRDMHSVHRSSFLAGWDAATRAAAEREAQEASHQGEQWAWAQARAVEQAVATERRLNIGTFEEATKLAVAQARAQERARIVTWLNETANDLQKNAGQRDAWEWAADRLAEGPA
jgi:hypothetical protein